MSRIELRGINKYYGKNHVLKDISLVIEDGEFMTLLGPSGCGKTTLLNMLGGWIIRQRERFGYMERYNKNEIGRTHGVSKKAYRICISELLSD